MTSFSRLTAGAAAHAPDGRAELLAAEAADHDQRTPEEDAPVVPAALEPGEAKVVLHAFPSGSRAGTLIHAVYEHVDFQRADPAELEAECAHQLALFGVDAGLHQAALVEGLAQSLRTPLPPHPRLTLAAIPRADRVDELEFTLSTAGSTLSAERLAAAFEAFRAPACDPQYAERLRALGEVPPAPYLKGFIDLVFRYEDRFYVVDYKSNRLGERARDYAPEHLVRAMREHDYYLQYHLYVLALHRHLAQRLPGYDYERHFGGVYYLFVRGMSPDHEPGTGIFHDRPELALIEALAEALGAARGGRS